MSQTVAVSECSSVSLTVDGNSTNTAGTYESSEFSDAHTEVAIKVLFVFTAGVLLVFSVPSLIALNCTRNIPKTACTLSSSLLLFDCATTISFALRQIVIEKNILNLITMVGLGWFTASIINIGVMALDRMILFQWPYFYIRYFSYGSFVYFYYVIVLFYLLGYTGRWILCFTNDPTFWEVRQCMNLIIISSLTVCFVCSMAVSIPSFVLIATIIKKQQRREHSRRETRPTIVVLICCLNYTFTVTVCLILLITICQTTIIFRRTATEMLFLFNGFVDTCVYVLWFKECRYELLRIVGIIFPPLKDKIMRMRNEVFDISSVSNVTQ